MIDDRPPPRIAVATRRRESRLCRLVHNWGVWTSYQVTRPVRCIGPSMRHLITTTEKRRRRQCMRCGCIDDRLVEARREFERDGESEGSSAVSARDLQT